MLLGKPPMPKGGPALKASSTSKSLLSAAPSAATLRLIPSQPVPPLPDPAASDDYVAIFKEEAASYLVDIEAALRELHEDITAEKPWILLRARFHTIKGAAATIDLPKTQKIATEAEDLALAAVDQFEFRNLKSWNLFLQLANETADSLELTLLSLVSSIADPAPSINSEATPPAPAAWDSDHRTSLSLIQVAQRILDDWQVKPELPSYQVEFKQCLDKLGQLLGQQGVQGLPLSFDQFSHFVESLQPGQFTEPFFVVARRCLGDASTYLESLSASPWLPWTRKWSFYFSSLRVALAAEARRPATFTTGSAVSEPIDPEMLEVFTQEAVTQFEQIEAGLIAWENGTDIPTQIKTIRRCFHTLKGAANSVDLRSLGHGFHLLEDYLDTLNPSATPEAIFQFLLGCLDQAKDYIQKLNISTSTTWTHDWKSSLNVLKQDPQQTVPAQNPVDLDMLETFVEEAVVLFEQIETAVLAWEKLDNEENQRATLRRCFHTLKGAANSIELASLGHAFHILEDFMDTVKAKEPPIGLFEVLLKCSDQVRAYIEELSKNNSAIWSHDWARSIDDLKKGKVQGASLAPVKSVESGSGEKTGSEERQVVRVEAERLRQVMHQVSEMIADHSNFESNAERLPPAMLRWNQSALEMGKILLSFENDLAPHRGGNSRSSGKLMRQMEAALTELTREFKAQGELREEFKALFDSFKEDNLQFRRNSRRLQNDLASLNMAPVSGLFRRLQRVFRDALKEEKKEAELQLEGEQTLLDKTVVDALYGPLLHVVRNAVAHGIETPDKRQELEKNRMGNVRISAKPLSNQVVIEVQDNGSGIHEAMVRKRAIERGMIPADAPDLNPDQIVELLFRPGFSTKETISSVAGRGVGLDVVKGEIESMNGSVNLDYKVGVGSTWTIKVPLTLSASEALIVQVGKQRLALPLGYVQRCVRILPGNRLQRQGIPSYQDERGIFPCIDLGAVLKMAGASKSNLGVLVDSGLVQTVFLVDTLIARREIVTKDIGSLIGSLSYLSGAYLDSDGSLIPILQIPNILQRLAAEITRSTTTQPLQNTEDNLNNDPLPAPPQQEETLQNIPSPVGEFILGRVPKILLCDDSASVRKVQEKQLLQMGYVVATANDGQEALERLETEDFDLVMTDLEMPRIDGFGLVKGIRSLERLNQLPVIVITSRALEKFAGETIELGATACLGKPFAAAQFERLIQNEPKLSGLRRQ